MKYRDHFNRLTGLSEPHQWQIDLAADCECSNRMIRIPTGFGKTLGVLAAWTYHRIVRSDERWPRRLVWCLPMRVLVEQTESEVRQALDRLGMLWHEDQDHTGKVGVHLLMGGVDISEWHLYPEHCAVLIGTQDMLLSRALNRGYGAARARWPMEFGLLNQDCLWVMDEVQLMDVGLATSGQLQSFRLDDQRANRALRPCHTWWMSATLQRSWLQVSPETELMASELTQTTIPPTNRKGPLWDDVRKAVRIEPADTNGVARLASQLHIDAGRGKNGPTVVVLNRVEDAVKVYTALSKDRSLTNTDLRLVHSRFRPHERAAWRDVFLNRASCTQGTDRIIVATQVIEAGVDISAAVLITQIAPWPNLVQRFGRAARWGGSAQVVIVDHQPKDDNAAAPYSKEAIDGAREALSQLTDVAPAHLESFESEHQELLPKLYPYAPTHLLLRQEIEELFDTTPDLSGADVDVSRFIRSGKDRDLQVFWEDIPPDEAPGQQIRPSRSALCAVPAYKVREWLCKEGNSEQLRAGKRAWVWDYLDGRWREAKRRDLYPGQTILIAAECGGYEATIGWDPASKSRVLPVPAASTPQDEQADSTQDDESLSVYPWQTIATHGRTVGSEAATIADVVAPRLRSLLDLSGRWHDVGKSHEAFNNSIRHDFPERPRRNDLAKAPKAAWLSRSKLYPDTQGRQRRGFRHELASALALFSVLRRHQPDHPALLGPWRTLLDMAGMSAVDQEFLASDLPNALEQEILSLSAEDFDLVAYLVCSHHGKVRFSWHASPADQAAMDNVLRIHGIRQGDTLPPITMVTAEGEFMELPTSHLLLDASAAGLNPVTGRGWTERTLGLLKQYGPFTLAYLEALLRAADQRASRREIADPLLQVESTDSASRGQFHGDGKQASQRATFPQTTQSPTPTTRYLDTTLGILNNTELAPYLAERVGMLEADIAGRVFAQRSLDEYLLLDLHRRICGELIPEIAGRWRDHDVQIEAHEPPPAQQVPDLMRKYGAELKKRFSQSSMWNNERLLELLVFAEGQLLHIRPFADFNDQVTRLFLMELLYRLELPIVDIATPTDAERQRNIAALHAFDTGNPNPWATIWRERFEKRSEA